ncbi:PREDICTED: uncharacterized protein LOC106818001 isoform X2 [Priapulus caudatus]|uniref:Uncharacterized protein LOC106818001 isoform X2 n=1 Tax=Priapulus caudatus TaxID=37621 RepID=A0ABM1F177_PRICU|nr:PREDICTED: uncharacterized protein LOC106818001 isoform X2 [Priapulus caudatus]
MLVYARQAKVTKIKGYGAISGTADGNHLLPQTSNFTAQSSSTEVLADVMEEEEEEDRCDATDEPMTPLLSPSAPGCPSEDDNKNISSTGLVLTAPRAESESLSDEEDETHGATKRARLSHDQPVPVDGQVCEWRWPTLHETERRDVPSVHNGTAATLCAAAGMGRAQTRGLRCQRGPAFVHHQVPQLQPTWMRPMPPGCRAVALMADRLRKRRHTGDENLTFRRRQYIRQCSIQYSQHYLLMRQLSRQPYTRPTEERTLKERIAFCVTGIVL